MAEIRSKVVITDGMSSALKSMNKALNAVISSFNTMQSATEQSIDVSSIEQARDELAQCAIEINRMANEMSDSEHETQQFGHAVSEANNQANLLGNTLKGVLATVMSLAAIKRGFDWIKESVGLFNNQNRSETQLKTVLKNMGAEVDAYDAIIGKAKELQSVTMYGDEAYIAGAAELATYFSDSDALQVMMDTLANYATGMSGGSELDSTAMTDYATGLGKVMTGAYDAMTKKGFEFTSQQKEIIENGSEMEAALAISEVINESWDNLANNMAKTPTGAIAQLKNALSDTREELAGSLIPAFMSLFRTIMQNMPNIEGIIMALSQPLQIVIGIINKIIEVASHVYEFFSNNWSKIAPLIMGIVSAMLAWKAIMLVNGIIAKAQSLAFIFQKGEETAAIATETGAIGAMTVAQEGFNMACMANPINLILMIALGIIIALAVAFATFTQEIMGALYWLGDLFKNVGLWFANVGLAIGQVFTNLWTIIENVGTTIKLVFLYIGRTVANVAGAIWAVISTVATNIANIIMNTATAIWESMKACAENIGIAFNNAWVFIQETFWKMVDGLMQGLKSIAEGINAAFGFAGINIDTSGLDFAKDKVNDLAGATKEYVDIGKVWDSNINNKDRPVNWDIASVWNEAMDANPVNWSNIGNVWKKNKPNWSSVNDAFGTFDVFEDGWGEKAYDAGAEVGKGIQDWISENISMNGLMKLLGIDTNFETQEDFYQDAVTDALGDIANNTGDTAGSTNDISKALDIAEEDLKYLRDVAEQSVINRFTTAEIKIDMNNTNNINGDMDIDGFVSALENKLYESMSIAAEGA